MTKCWFYDYEVSECTDFTLLHACTVECGTDALLRVLKLCHLIIREVHLERTHNTVLTDHARDGERHVLDAILALHDSSTGQDRVLVEEDCLDEAAGDHGDTGIGKALEIDDIVCRLYDPLLDIVAVQLLLKVEILVEVIDAETGAVDRRPCDKGIVAVLAEHIAVDVLRIHIVVLRKEVAETVGLEHRARAEDLLARIVKLGRYDVGRNIERIRDHDDHGFLRVFHDLREDGAHDLRVRARELQSVGRLPGQDRGPRRDDDKRRIAAVLIRARMDLDVRAVR